MAGAGRKLATLNHKQKRDVCLHKQRNPAMSNRDLKAWILETMKLAVSEPTISRLLNKSFAILCNTVGNEVKRLRTPTCPAVEAALYKWFLSAQESKLPISDDNLIVKGREFHDLLRSRNALQGDSEDCKFSTGWLTGFKKTHNITLRALHGEEDSCVLSETTWDLFNVLKAQLSGYDWWKLANGTVDAKKLWTYTGPGALPPPPEIIDPKPKRGRS